jgi:hypothetical protein
VPDRFSIETRVSIPAPVSCATPWMWRSTWTPTGEVWNAARSMPAPPSRMSLSAPPSR